MSTIFEEIYNEGVMIGRVEIFYLVYGMSIQDIAKEIGISEEYVEEIIDNEINSKAKEEAKLKAKLDIAENMLKNSTLDVTEISDITGLDKRQILKIEGKLKAILKIAKNLSKLNILSVSNISEVTELSKDQIFQLRGENIMGSVLEEIRAEVRKEKSIEIAESLLRLGTVSIADISTAVGLSEEHILKIKEEIK